MTPDAAIAALDDEAGDLVRRYRDLGKIAALARTNDGHVQIITLANNDPGIARLMYAAADTFADRAYYKSLEDQGGTADK